VAISVAWEQRIELLGTVELLHEHLTTSLCQTVFQQTRTTERERQWSLEALVSFWTEVILRAPQSLTQALQEAALGNGSGWPPVQASPEAFFQRCQSLEWRFFANLYEAFLIHVLPQAQPCYASPIYTLREHFQEVWIVDGSRLDAVAKRLKLLWDVRAQVLPGCLTAFYDLYRGMIRHLAFNADAAAGELPRAIAALEHVPEGTLLVGDRLYGVGAFFAALREQGLFGLCRRNGRQSWRWLRELSKTYSAEGTAWDTLIEIKGKKDIPTQTLRWLRWRKGRESWEMLTNVVEPQRLSIRDALRLYPWRWKVERLFFDLKEVLNLHRFYTSSPNGVAMQVYAAALVHTAFRVAQGHIAQAIGTQPEEISPAKFFPRMAAAAIGWTWSEVAFIEIQKANPGIDLQKPDWHRCEFAWTTFEHIRVESRNGRRRKRRFCKSRKQWKSFTHIPGGKKLT
jgi:DDE family transposase